MKNESYENSVRAIPKDYYSFESYNSKNRILTYWYQITEIISTKPKSVLEIGIGSGMITGYLKQIGIEVKTLDVNRNLNPDFLYSVLDLKNNALNIGLYDVVVCCRVLHHVEFINLEHALENIHSTTKKYVVLSLPVDEARFYLMSRYTSSPIFTISIKFPNFFKKLYKQIAKGNIGSGLWQINSSKETSLQNVNSIINKNFKIIRGYQVPEDKSHYIYLLEKKPLP